MKSPTLIGTFLRYMLPCRRQPLLGKAVCLRFPNPEHGVARARIEPSEHQPREALIGSFRLGCRQDPYYSNQPAVRGHLYLHPVAQAEVLDLQLGSVRSLDLGLRD